MMDKVIFLDRDGTININPYRGSYILSVKEFKFIDNSIKALKILEELGYKLIVVTNQRCVHLGLIDKNRVEEIHKFMYDELVKNGVKLDGIYYCPHDIDSCDCRKPKTGMLENAVKDLNLIIDKDNSYMVGDSPNDILVGINFNKKFSYVANSNSNSNSNSTSSSKCDYDEANRVLKTVFLNNDLYSLDEVDTKLKSDLTFDSLYDFAIYLKNNC